MNYEELKGKIESELTFGSNEEAQVLATMAVADRLDRLCEILSARGGKR